MPESLTERINVLRHTPAWKLKKAGQNTSRLDAFELERRWDAMTLRRSGASYSQIAKALKIAINTARDDVLWCMDQVLIEPAEEVRRLELDRLDALQMAMWKKAIDGDVVAVDRVLKIMATRDRILGIDAPQDADMNYIARMAEEISKQLGIPVADILGEAEMIARQQWLDGGRYEPIEGEVIASEYTDTAPTE